MMMTCLIGEVVFLPLLPVSVWDCARRGVATSNCAATNMARTCLPLGKFSRHLDRRECIYTTSMTGRVAQPSGLEGWNKRECIYTTSMTGRVAQPSGLEVWNTRASCVVVPCYALATAR